MSTKRSNHPGRTPAMKAHDVKIGARVRLARTLLNMSQEKLGDALGLTFQQVQKYEKGANRIGGSRMQQISGVLQQPVAYFFQDLSGQAQETGADIVTQMLTLPYGVDLARDYIAIVHNADRSVVAQVARAIAPPQLRV